MESEVDGERGICRERGYGEKNGERDMERERICRERWRERDGERHMERERIWRERERIWRERGYTERDGERDMERDMVREAYGEREDMESRDIMDYTLEQWVKKKCFTVLTKLGVCKNRKKSKE